MIENTNERIADTELEQAAGGEATTEVVYACPVCGHVLEKHKNPIGGYFYKCPVCKKRRNVKDGSATEYHTTSGEF